MPKGNDKGRKGKGPDRVRSTNRHVLSEDQPGLSHSVSEADDNPDPPRQKIRSNSADQQETIRKHHLGMVVELSNRFSLQSNEWRSICSQVEMMNYLSTLDMDDVKDMFGLCKALQKRGKIDYGEYSKLRDILVKCDVETGRIIDICTERIRREKQGQPQAKRQKTMYNKREPHSTGQPQAKRQRAGDDRIQRQTKRQRAGDDLGQIQTKRQKAGDDLEQQQSTEFSPKIAASIERTKAMIEDKKGPFIVTKGFQDAKEKLHKNGVVVIKGNTGDGKTTAAIRLILSLIEEQQGRQPLQLHNLEDLDLLSPKSKLITFIDDIFGEKVAHEKDVGEWNKRIKSVLPTLCGDKPTQANFLIITIRNEIFNSLKSNSLENVLVDSNIIDLSSNDYKIKKEKLELLELYKPKNDEFSWRENEKEKIVMYATDIGFPQCCRLFRDFPDLQKERVEFFKKPFYFLNRVLEKLEECPAILFLFLNKWGIVAKDLDPNGEKVNKTLLDEAFDIDLKGAGVNRPELKYKQKVEFVRKSLDTLSGFLVVKEKEWFSDGFVYRFAHDSIYATVELLYRQITPIGFIKYCPRESLRCFTISKSSPDRIMLSPDHYVYMFERIHREFESRWSDMDESSYVDVCHARHQFELLNAVSDVYDTIGSQKGLTDRQFIKNFVRWLDAKNIHKTDVLYVLSEAVKPDTPWASLFTREWSKDMEDLQESVIEYMSGEIKLGFIIGTEKYVGYCTRGWSVHICRH